MTEVLDDELQGLLDELRDDPVEPPPDQTLPTNDLEFPVQLDSPELLEPTFAPPLEPAPDSNLLDIDAPPDDGLVKIKEFLVTHDRDYEETKNNIKNDRAKVDIVLQILLTKVQAGGASAAETESLVACAKA